jgi:pimeloyl-ACP methyl ester carboxylesterase
MNRSSMPGAYFSFGSSRIHYSYWGTGDRLLLCFHGYGESSASFAFLEEALGGQLTILAIDLPYHGGTEWLGGFYLDPRDLLTILDGIIAGLPCQSEGWWLLGYSMGGRVALQLLQLAPEKVRRMILLAPDGLIVNPWYWLATQTRLGNTLFRATMRRPGWFFSLLRLANVLKLVNPSVYKFTIHYIHDEPFRQDLYIRWTTMRGFRPRLPVIRNIIRSGQLPVALIYGRYDRIIRWERGEKFRKKGIADYCRLTLLPAGHQVLQTQYLDVLRSALKEGGGLFASPGVNTSL